MKTRILSGAVLIAAVALIMGLGTRFPLVISAAMAAVCAVGVYEMVHNALGLSEKKFWIAGCVYGLFTVLCGAGIFGSAVGFSLPTLLYFYYLAACSIFLYGRLEPVKTALAFALPVMIVFAFCRFEGVISGENGIYYLLLLLNFSSVCDMGAYFAGVALGRHKLCPAISPKKTVEGAVGGLAAGLLGSLILVLAFGMKGKLWVTLLLTLPFCMLGMAGDLIASVIKRRAGIKDYGALIPGHGGILDRTDSILMIAPFFAAFVRMGVL